MAKAKFEESIKFLKLPGGTVLNQGDKINYQNTLGERRIGTVGRIRPDTGEYGWINVLDIHSKQYEDISIAVQLSHMDESEIPFQEPASKLKKVD